MPTHSMFYVLEEITGSRNCVSKYNVLPWVRYMLLGKPNAILKGKCKITSSKTVEINVNCYLKNKNHFYSIKQFRKQFEHDVF